MNYSKNRCKREFYLRNTLTVAKELLGKFLIHNSDEGTTVGKIVETEAYIGPHDAASHAYRGRRTKRTEIQFGLGGFAYIYQLYGIHFCFNVVTQEINMPEAVLIRALEPIEGFKLMSKRRKFSKITDSNLKELTNGPGKLCQAMGINKSLYGIDLCGNVLFISSINFKEDLEIITTPRINIEYSKESKSLPWRFLIKNDEYVSVNI
ncbi:MAG: DNA-3-methyladenine glycosylase [Candidatus Hodarchaeota archaeon]